MKLDEINNQKIKTWVQEIADLCKPKDIYVCDGSDAEYTQMAEELVKSGTFVKLDESKRPNSYYCQSDPSDVARVEERTFICSQNEKDAGPTNHWCDPNEMRTKMRGLYEGCMKGRTMYVVPFSMGPLGSNIAHIGIEISDSPYVVCNMKIMTRMGKAVFDVLGSDGDFIKCLHSIGSPEGSPTFGTKWPCEPDVNNKYITHFPETKEIWSYGSGYGGNALLGKKCLALRIASSMAKEQGWLAEHMLILGITSPAGVKKYIAGAFPSACGKTNLAMLKATLPGWKVECVGDDIAWMKFDENGQLRAINPESGFFGVAPGTSDDSNYYAMRSMDSNSIFTNVALTEDKDVWWEEIGWDASFPITDWKGNKYDSDPGKDVKLAHPNSRFTSPASQCPIIDPAWEDPKGVVIDAILFGGRRASLIPLVHESFDWEHGVLLGAMCASEKTAAALGGGIGQVRRDPFAMLPFCGYNMGDYFKHWLNVGQKGSKLPKIFYVNWFRKNADGKFIWPGFGDNIRVLKWVFERCAGEGEAVKTPIGYTPSENSLDTNGIDVPAADMQELLKVDPAEWSSELPAIEEYFAKFGDQFPSELKTQLEALKERLK